MLSKKNVGKFGITVRDPWIVSEGEDVYLCETMKENKSGEKKKERKKERMNEVLL